MIQSTKNSNTPLARVAKNIPVAERLVVALDVPTMEQAWAIVEELGTSCHFYKIGLEIFASRDGFPLLDRLLAANKKVFVDLKFFDVPQTVAGAVRSLAKSGAHLTTVHGNQAIMEAAVSEKGSLKILAVTALTSLDRGDLDDLGFSCDVEALVLSRARRALAIGVDGIVSSGLEAQAIRQELGDRLLVVTPGIRPIENSASDDQKRTVTVAEAFANGADYIVVGRPIVQVPDPRLAADAVQNIISKIFFPVT